MKLPTWQDIVSVYDRATGKAKAAPPPPAPEPTRKGAIGYWATLVALTGSHVYPMWGPPHETGIEPCWCGPKHQCLYCDRTGPCIHGTRRREAIVHRQPS